MTLLAVATGSLSVRKLSGRLQASFIIRWLPACHNQERITQRTAIVDDFPAKRFTLQGEAEKTFILVETGDQGDSNPAIMRISSIWLPAFVLA
jgi:hypothetical protein